MSRILVADDEPYILRSLAFALRQDGHQVATARDGAEALERLDGGGFDLLFLDILMPNVDGFGVVEKLRERHGGALPVKVVFLSAKGMDEDRDHALGLGASAFLAKPFSPLAVNRLVADLCPAAAAGKSGS